ncbi:agmatinase [Natrialba magadii ATCC 43099]|uniref:Agmatinase n=1 Tax=Natrialba magadii (strain ATCC 43099 / DSM 3394 / CCM 3739 / CIP 104546 / IAM 13178 / JCM 8861 / NBRC 102185 / NCIMB 2190 / MS3) TaxID=547559 RepID=D3SUV0_NATMM|nr:agmatinase [Natrialba magadii]ADD05358.1 agmatinase [Natrialba magadii ATCC 43099]ELY29324.1 arginase/agmatinase/formiminoglutamase [Natrialba magadii ATCC 43099]
MSDQHPAAAFRESVEGANVELAYAGAKTFLKGEMRDVGAVSDVDAATFGVPYDGAVSNRPGARYGPQAIRRASGWWAYLSDYKGGLTNMQTGKQVNFDDLTVADCGDAPIFPMDSETTAESITAHMATVASQTFPVMLGGDHYCTFPALRGFAEGAGHDTVGFVQIDAHTDTTSESPVFGTDFHGSSTSLIANSEYTDYENVSQVGIRGYESPEFFEFAEETGLNLYTMRDVEDQGITSAVADAVAAAAEGTDAVYVSFDIDAVDPSVAPGTGTPVPGGLTPHQALKTMEVLGETDDVGAVDMMEVAPRYDSDEGTQRLAAYLLVTLLERKFAE